MALAAASDAGSGGAEAQVQRLIQWAEACGKIIPEHDFESLHLRFGFIDC